MQPSLPRPHVPPEHKRHHLSLFHPINFFFHVVGMMITLAVAGARIRCARCEDDDTSLDQMLGARPNSGAQDLTVDQPTLDDDDLVSISVVMTSLRGDQPARRTRYPVRRVFRRKITSPAIMRAMHVTNAMADCLGLHLAWLEGSANDSQRWATWAAEVDARPGGQGQASASSDDQRPVFWRVMTLRDPAGCFWPVVYEAFMSNRQYHRRLSEGWRAFCRHHGVKVNDTIEFRRCLTHKDLGMLAVRVVRRGGRP